VFAKVPLIETRNAPRTLESLLNTHTLRTVYNLFCLYRRTGASPMFAARRALRVYRHGF
jgi:hypothetical protein